ncbi:unnamed protein product [Umbelopsis ramanniana]
MECTPTSIDGVVYNHFIKAIFGECVYGYKETLSLLFGYASILSWLNAQLPQVIENYRRSSAESLSLTFLMIWLAGDISNLVGCLLTDQLAFQKYLGVYFVWIDCTLLSQWIYYNYISPPPTIVHLPESAILAFDYPDLKVQNLHNDIRPMSIPRNYNHSSSSSRAEQSPLLTISDEALSPPYSASASPSKWYTLGDMAPQRTPSPRIILSAIFMFSLKTQASSTLTTTQSIHSTMLQIDHLLVGRIFAWLCAALYLASRVPQILKNQQRKSVDGLSSALFIFAALGNLTYTTSILLSSAVQSRAKFMEALPYLLGSIGTLVFDTIIFSQFIWYRQRRIDSVGA